MGRRFKIERDCYDDDEILYKKGYVEFNPGLTVLVGCNGCGKTTLMRQIQRMVKKELGEECIIYYDNIQHGGNSSIQHSMFYGDMQFVAVSACSSEGERISLNMQKTAGKIGSMMRKHPDKKEFWILLDGVDSGFSIDAIEDLKRGLFDTILETYRDKDIYIIVSANEYEMARGEMCFDVVGCRYVNIRSYERYRSIVMKSREYKDKRIAAAIEKRKAERNAENTEEGEMEDTKEAEERTWKKER